MTASFPQSVWDGTTRQRANYSVQRGPDGYDFDRISEEVRAAQRHILNQSAVNPTTITSSVTLEAGPQFLLVDASGGEVELTMPDPSLQAGMIIVKKIDASANHVVLVPHGSETIDGDTELRITARWSAPLLGTDKTNWYIA